MHIHKRFSFSDFKFLKRKLCPILFYVVYKHPLGSIYILWCYRLDGDHQVCRVDLRTPPVSPCSFTCCFKVATQHKDSRITSEAFVWIFSLRIDLATLPRAQGKTMQRREECWGWWGMLGVILVLSLRKIKMKYRAFVWNGLLGNL